MKKIVIASNNKGKIKEIANIFGDRYELLSLKDVNCDVDVVEDGNTFEENATKKAREIANITGYPTIADDSGICVTELDGWPGIYTHRCAGEDSTKEERNECVLAKVRNLPEDKRQATVECVLVYMEPQKETSIVGYGTLHGTIVEPRGENGFGFDPIFEFENGKTLGELSQEEKDSTSARYLAACDLKLKLDKKEEKC